MTDNKRQKPGPKTECDEVLVNKPLLSVLTELQYSLLDNLSRESGKSKSKLVREALDIVYFNK